MILVAGCAGTGSYVWVQDIPESAVQENTLLAGDVVSIRVLGQEAMTTRARIPEDGRIALPLVGEIDTRGKRPGAVRAELESRYKEFFQVPSVTVNVEEEHVVVAVIGEVSKPGIVNLEHGAGVVHALASAGGLTEFADDSRVFVVRSRPKPLRVRFTYESIARGEGHAGSFRLQRGDVVVVE